MTKIWGRPDDTPKPKVNFDEDGLPIGENKSDFVEFLGTMARNGKYAPLCITDWRLMPSERMEEMIDVVKVTCPNSFENIDEIIEVFLHLLTIAYLKW